MKGKQVMDSGLKVDCTEDALTLLAACYMQIDISKNWSQIIEILDYGGNKIFAFNGESINDACMFSIRSNCCKLGA